MVMFIPAGRPSRPDESGGTFPQAFCRVLAKKISANIAHEGRTAIVTPPAIVAARGDKCNILMRTPNTQVFIGFGVLPPVVSLRYGQEKKQWVSYMNTKSVMALMADLKKPEGALNPSQFQSTATW
jgi:hypothetical protein